MKNIILFIVLVFSTTNFVQAKVYCRLMTKIPSFVYKKPCLCTISENGVAMCLKEETGEIVWRERIGGKFSASPLLSGDKIYLTDENARTTVIKVGPRFGVIAKNNLTGKCQSSMAVAKEHILFRTDSHLYCIKNK